MKIKSLEEEIKKLKNENTTFRENILTQLKIIENVSGYNDRSTTNTPIIDKTKQKNDYNINNSNWQIAHSSKISNKRQRESMDIYFETNNKFTPLLTENADDVTKCSSTNIASANSKKSHPNKLISHFERKRRPDICVTENYIKISHQLQYLAIATMPVYQRMVVKYSLYVIAMSNELEESILIKNLDMAKLIFVASAVQQVSN